MTYMVWDINRARTIAFDLSYGEATRLADLRETCDNRAFSVLPMRALPLPSPRANCATIRV